MLVTVDISEEERSALMRMNFIDDFVSVQSLDNGLKLDVKTVHRLSKRIIHELTESEVRRAYRLNNIGKPDILTHEEIRFVRILYGQLAGTVEEIAQDRGELIKTMKELIMMHGVPRCVQIDIGGKKHDWVLVKKDKEKTYFNFP